MPNASERQPQSGRGERLASDQQAVEQPIEEVLTAALKRLGKVRAEKFAADYIENEESEGRHPTLKGLEAKQKETGLRGGREHLRATFRNKMGGEVSRGRPRKSPEKFAKK
jgi:hypothetical protein